MELSKVNSNGSTLPLQWLNFNDTLLPSHLSVYCNTVFSSLITTVAIIGNLAMISIFLRHKNFRDLNNTAITILSLSDVFRASIVMIPKIYHQMNFATTLTEPTCTVTAFVCGFTFVFSPMLLALIGVVRYCKVVPANYRTFDLTDVMFYRSVILLIIIATTFACLPIVGITGEYTYSPSHGVCFSDWRHKNEIFRTIFYLLVIGFAFPVLIIFYTRLFRALRVHYKGVKKRIETGYASEEVSTEKESSVDENVPTLVIRNSKIAERSLPIGKSDENVQSTSRKPNNNDMREIKENNDFTDMREIKEDKKTYNAIFKSCPIAIVTRKKIYTPQNEEKSNVPRSVLASVNNANKNFIPRSNKISKQELQVTNAMMLIVAAYCICWFPAAILNAAALYHRENTNTKIPLIYFYVIVTMVELKCALNPIIYGWGNRKYRNVMKNMLKVVRNKTTQLFA